jgi:hypothetical protein
MGCNLVEASLGRMWRAKSVAAGFSVLNAKAIIDGITLMLILIIVLLPFFAAREYRRILGKDILQAAKLRSCDAKHHSWSHSTGPPKIRAYAHPQNRSFGCVSSLHKRMDAV